jgi:ferric-dicitrate binding protein FerR (iron transport regulator)
MTIGGGASLRVRLSYKDRTVKLDRGDALFEVRRDPHRPSAVRAATESITASGTEFVVRRYSHQSTRFDVWVMEGTVDVAPTRNVVPGKGPVHLGELDLSTPQRGAESRVRRSGPGESGPDL